MAQLLSVRLSKNQDTFDDHHASGLEPLLVHVPLHLFLKHYYQENDGYRYNLCGQANVLQCSYITRQAQHLHVLK